MKEKLEKDTRKLFHKIHTEQAQDEFIYHRLVSLLNTDFLKVKKDFFKNKICLDAGCGSNANATISMINMGAKMVYPMDLDDTVSEILPKIDTNFKGKYEFTVGNVLEMDFEDNFFDFSHCAGVLHHTDDVEKGIKELIRVTKPGGMIYIETYGKGGLVRDIVGFFRNKYQNSNEFRNLINNLSYEDIQEFISWSFLLMRENGDSYANRISKDDIETLFDRDLILTIKDRIMAPVYHENSEEEITSWLNILGCTKIQRLARYPNMKNIRRFLCPLYSEYNSKYAKLLYGDGNLGIKAIKR